MGAFRISSRHRRNPGVMVSGTVSGGAHLQIEGLSAWYGQVRAIRDVSLSVDCGEVVAILGRNGAGKSTLLRSIARIHHAATGRVALGGDDIMSMRPDAVVARGMSLVREGGRVFETLTVHENLLLAKRVAGLRQQSREIEEIEEWFPPLFRLLNAKGGHLSGGERQMLALAMAFLGNPNCLLLDEPSAGLAESICEAMYETIGRIASQEVALLIAEQDPRWIKGLANRAYLIELGAVDREVDPEEVGHGELSWS